MADQENFDDAMTACEKALAFLSGQRRANRRNRGYVSNYGRIHEANGEYDKSSILYEKADRILMDRLGLDAPFCGASSKQYPIRLREATNILQRLSTFAVRHWRFEERSSVRITSIRATRSTISQT
jgi:tetratricopeptide (TPR) repeat protein